MGLIWNNEYVLEKNKEPRKTCYFSTEAAATAENCFQVWHCSANEFVLYFGRLTASVLPLISLSHTHTHLLIISAFVFLLYGLRIHPLLDSLNVLCLPDRSVLRILLCVSVLHLCFTRCSLSLFLFARGMLTTQEVSIFLFVVHSKLFTLTSDACSDLL